MSPFSAAVLLLLLPGICVGQQWRRWDHHRQPWQRWRDAGDKTPAPPSLQCTGYKVPVPCNELNATDVDRMCPVYEAKYGQSRTLRCYKRQRGAMCACRLPNRVDALRNCMPVEKCLTCVANAAYSSCFADRRCQRTCDWPGQRICPWEGCKKGCVCNDGFLRDEATGECVTRDRCSAPKPVECTGNKVPVLCNEMNATNVNRLCPMFATDHGTKNRWYRRDCIGADERRVALCACKLPYRTDPRPNNDCVHVGQCPICTASERYSLCSANCRQPSCGRPQRPRKCPRPCVGGCVCIWGHLRDEASGKCVPEDKCPDTATRMAMKWW